MMFNFESIDNCLEISVLTFEALAPKNSQAHSNNSSGIAEELLGCI